MNIIQATTAVTEMAETAATVGARAYVIGSEVFTVSAILWCLNMMGNMVEKVYQAGTVSGEFYKTYLHSYTLKGIALVILLGQLFYEGCQVVYNNREEIRENTISFWHSVEGLFTYSSPVVA